MVAPVFGASYVPPRIASCWPGAVTLAALPLMPRTAVCRAVGRRHDHHRAAGCDRRCLGFALQLMFDALTSAASCWPTAWVWALPSTSIRCAVSDSRRLGQFYVVLGTLVSGAQRPHRADRDWSRAFVGCRSAPQASRPQQAIITGQPGAARCLPGALRIALPGITALLVINMAFGV
jgi:flagellar biosynthesis protein FliR